MTNKQLLNEAIKAQKKSYAPYSGFNVGAALLCKNGKVYTGCNIENSSFPATVCAERTAFFKAISEGEREFEKIAIVGGKNYNNGDLCYPCGVCRQVMAEFCSSEFLIILKNGSSEQEFTLCELFPFAFNL